MFTFCFTSILFIIHPSAILFWFVVGVAWGSSSYFGVCFCWCSMGETPMLLCTWFCCPFSLCGRDHQAGFMVWAHPIGSHCMDFLASANGKAPWVRAQCGVHCYKFSWVLSAHTEQMPLPSIGLYWMIMFKRSGWCLLRCPVWLEGIKAFTGPNNCLVPGLPCGGGLFGRASSVLSASPQVTEWRPLHFGALGKELRTR